MKLQRFGFVRVIVTLVIVAVGIDEIASDAQAGRPYGRRYSYGRNRNYYGPPPPPARLPTVSTAEVEAANQRLISARAELDRAQRAFDQFFLKNSNSDGLAEALAELRDARVAHDQADAAVGQSLRGNSEFVAALARKEQAQRRLASLRESGAGNAEQITVLAKEAMEWGNRSTQIQADVENADPTVAETKARLLAADERVRTLGAAANESLRTDPAWIAAKDAREQAKLNVDAARLELSAAEQRLAAAQDAYAQASVYNQRRGYPNTRSGRAGHW